VGSTPTRYKVFILFVIMHFFALFLKMRYIFYTYTFLVKTLTFFTTFGAISLVGKILACHAGVMGSTPILLIYFLFFVLCILLTLTGDCIMYSVFRFILFCWFFSMLVFDRFLLLCTIYLIYYNLIT